MQVFKANKNKFLANELRSWVYTFGAGVIIYFVSNLVLTNSSETSFVFFLVIFLLKLSDTFTHFHTTEIQIDQSENKLTFLLKSLMTGNKEKSFNLSDTKLETVQRNRFPFFGQTEPNLRFYLPGNKIFKINSRYGFSKETLETLDQAFLKINPL
jgi:hypothetical protein